MIEAQRIKVPAIAGDEYGDNYFAIDKQGHFGVVGIKARQQILRRYRLYLKPEEIKGHGLLPLALVSIPIDVSRLIIESKQELMPNLWFLYGNLNDRINHGEWPTRVIKRDDWILEHADEVAAAWLRESWIVAETGEVVDLLKEEQAHEK